jgi:hypothetical protein
MTDETERAVALRSGPGEDRSRVAPAEASERGQYRQPAWPDTNVWPTDLRQHRAQGSRPGTPFVACTFALNAALQVVFAITGGALRGSLTFYGKLS